MTVWHLVGAGIGLALVVAWTWWHLRVRGEAHRLMREAWQADAWHYRFGQRLRSSEVVQIDDPESHQRHVDAYLHHAAAIDAENQRLIESFRREFEARCAHDRAMAEQRQLDACDHYLGISAWERAMIAKFQREYAEHADLRAQRRLDEMEL